MFSFWTNQLDIHVEGIVKETVEFKGLQFQDTLGPAVKTQESAAFIFEASVLDKIIEGMHVNKEENRSQERKRQWCSGGQMKTVIPSPASGI